MNIVLLVLILLFWLAISLQSILFWLHYIQIKQYRVDRIYSSLKQKSFYKLVLSKYRIGLLFLAILPLSYYIDFLSLNNKLVLFLIISSGIWLSLYIIKGIRQFFHKTLQLPTITSKVLVLTAVILIIEAFILRSNVTNIILFELLMPFIVISLVSILYIPNLILFKIKFKQANAKIKKLKQNKLKVIAITGSYGKTRTKEYITHLLSKKFNTISTPAHINIDIGIANFILDKVNEEHDYLIVEAGAYKKGEIKTICDMVLPDYGVMTYLGKQHLELFGSEQKLAQAKFELVYAVKAEKSIFANKDSENLVKAFEKRNINPYYYSLSSLKEEYKKSIDIFDDAALTNLSGAILVAEKLGLSDSQIQSGLADLPTLENTMEKKEGINGSIYIDDSYNAGPAAAKMAIKSLNNLGKKKKIIIFDEFIELGKLSKKEHIEFAKYLDKNINSAYFLDSSKKDLLLKHFTGKVYASIDELKQNIDSNTVLLFEGRKSQSILARL